MIRGGRVPATPARRKLDTNQLPHALAYILLKAQPIAINALPKHWRAEYAHAIDERLRKRTQS